MIGGVQKYGCNLHLKRQNSADCTCNQSDRERKMKGTKEELTKKARMKKNPEDLLFLTWRFIVLKLWRLVVSKDRYTQGVLFRRMILNYSKGPLFSYSFLDEQTSAIMNQGRRKALRRQSIGGASDCLWTMVCPSNALFAHKYTLAEVPKNWCLSNTGALTVYLHFFGWTFGIMKHQNNDSGISKTRKSEWWFD